MLVDLKRAPIPDDNLYMGGPDVVGKSKGRDYRVIYESADLKIALKDDNDFMEIITMIIEAELLD